MEYRVRSVPDGVFIEINDKKEGWMPLFGANRRGDFVGMPTCWPFDERSDPAGGGRNIIMLDTDLLLKHSAHIRTRRKRRVFGIMLFVVLAGR